MRLSFATSNSNFLDQKQDAIRHYLRRNGFHWRYAKHFNSQQLAADSRDAVPFTRALKKAHPDWSITAYVRSNKSTEELKLHLSADRIEVGEFGDFDKIKALSKEHDIAINAGNSFTGEPVLAIIAGLKERPSESKGKLIHVSGMLFNRQIH